MKYFEDEFWFFNKKIDWKEKKIDIKIIFWWIN